MKKQNIPKLRFKGFDDDWRQKKLIDMGYSFTGLSGKTKDDFGHGDARFVTYINVYGNAISDITGTDKIEIDENQNALRKGDILFTTSSETPSEVGMSSVWLSDEENIYLNSFCFGYRPEYKNNNFYMAHMLRSHSARKKISFLAQGISRYNISKNAVLNIDFNFPDLPEQSAIGSLFQTLDELLSAYKDNLANYQAFKASMLSKMFPKAGRTTPEIRLDGFDGEWEIMTLGELVEIRGRIGFRGYTVEDIVSKKDGVLTFGPTNIQNNLLVSTANDTYITIAKYNESPEIQLKNSDILFVKTGSTLGKSALIKALDEKATVNPQIVVLKQKETDSQFLSAYLLSTYLLRQVNAVKIGGAVPTLTEKEIREFSVSVPLSPEQRAIGAFFANLDDLITSQQAKITELETLKKKLLQDMFI